MRLLRYLPFSYMWCLSVLVGSPKTVLDIGCGEGDLMDEIANNDWKITGIDIYEKSLKEARKKKIYKELIKGEIVKVCQKLEKQGKKFDLVFCSQVIEHIKKSDGEKLLSVSEKLAKGRIYFGTPRGFMEQPKVFLKGNPYQIHRSGWQINDFLKRGYKVYGVGFYPVWSENGWARHPSRVIATLAAIISFLFSPLVFFIPTFGSGIMAIKYKEVKILR